MKVGIVNYLNTLPLLYGLEHSSLASRIELIKDYPARIAALLENGQIDIGLIPVASLPHIPKGQLIADFGIASDGPVASVGLLSQAPLEDIEEVLLDYQSKTSVALLKILLEHHWNKSVRLIPGEAGLEKNISGHTAGLLIGDRCLRYRSQVNYVYDLGEAWKSFTGLPFVYAAWVSNRELPAHFIREFNQANAAGVKAIDRILQQQSITYYDLRKYYHENIRYTLGDAERKGLSNFLALLQSHPELSPPVNHL